MNHRIPKRPAPLTAFRERADAMHNSCRDRQRFPYGARSRLRGVFMAVSCLAGSFLSGCAAMTNPVADGIPVRRVPPELLARAKCEEQTIPLTLLRQSQPPVYRLAVGDVLGVYIEGILGDRTQPIPLHVAPPTLPRDTRRLPPAMGYPVTVDENGTITLPRVGPLSVQGMSLAQAREAIRDLYLKKEILKPGNEQIFVTLLNPRQHQVLVFRQETATLAVSTDGLVTNGRRGTGHLVDLPGFENDVLHALAQTGGLPSLEDYNEIIIMRDCFASEADRALLLNQIEAMPRGVHPLQGVERRGNVLRIPLRLPPGKTLPIRPEDVILNTGDVVFLEARDHEFFFTGGLLPPGAHLLPRDTDLDVLEAVSQIKGPLFNGAFGGSNLSGNLLNPGLGNPSPSMLIVLRKTPKCGQVPIAVDLNEAMRHPQERILVQAGDVLILQEAPGEAMVRYLSTTFFNFDIFWQAFHSKYATGIIDIATPDRLPSRVGTIQANTP
jgi:protein involved in polysaccharide export with SLBB domain